MTPLFVGFIGTTELILILVIVVLLFGVGKLRDVGKELGAGIRGFKAEISGNEGGEAKTEQVTAEPRDVTDETTPRPS
jgi:sec-independent protein translocase protein TatA